MAATLLETSYTPTCNGWEFYSCGEIAEYGGYMWKVFICRVIEHLLVTMLLLVVWYEQCWTNRELLRWVVIGVVILPRARIMMA